MSHPRGIRDSDSATAEGRWRLACLGLPLLVVALLLGRVWLHPHEVVGHDQWPGQRIIDNAGPYLLAPGSAPWAWPATAPACLNDHLIGLALLMLPWQALGVGFMPALWLTTALTLALGGTLLGVLLRRWGLAPLAAVSAGVLVAGLPVFVQRLQHTANLEVIWILAWVIAFDRWCEAAGPAPQRWRAVHLALAGLGLAIMPATVLQWTAPTAPVLVVIVLARWRPSARTLLAAAATQVPGLLLFAWIYHPYFGNGHAPNVIIPSPWQDLAQPLGAVAWPTDGQHSDALCNPGPVPILGVAGLVVAIIAPSNRPRRLAAAVILLAVLGNLLLAVSIGNWSAVDHLRGVPLFSGMRSPARFAIPACVLAVAGVALLIDAVAARHRRAAIGLAVAALIAQMLCTGAVAPLRLFEHHPLPPAVAETSAACRPGPLLALPIGILDDSLALATGRVTVGTSSGRPTDWHFLLDSGDADTVARIILALHRLGLAAVVTDDSQVGPVLADILRRQGARPHAGGAPNLTWWELPPAPPGDGTCAAVLTRITVTDGHGAPLPGWSLAISGDPGAEPVGCRVQCGSFSMAIEQFLPGTRTMELVFPGADQPRLTWSRPIPVSIATDGH